MLQFISFCILLSLTFISAATLGMETENQPTKIAALSSSINHFHEKFCLPQALTCWTMNKIHKFVPMLNVLEDQQLSIDELNQLQEQNLFFKKFVKLGTTTITTSLKNLNIKDIDHLSTLHNHILPHTIPEYLKIYLIKLVHDTITYNYKIAFDHDTPITCWDMCEKGKRLATATRNKNVYIFNLKNGKCIPLTQCTNTIKDIKLSSDGSHTTLYLKDNREKKGFLQTWNNKTKTLVDEWDTAPYYLHFMHYDDQEGITAVGTTKENCYPLSHYEFKPHKAEPTIRKIPSTELFFYTIEQHNANNPQAPFVEIQHNEEGRDTILVPQKSLSFFYAYKIAKNAKTADEFTIIQATANESCHLTFLEKKLMNQIIQGKKNKHAAKRNSFFTSSSSQELEYFAMHHMHKDDVL
jgi:WD40 repeat protein